MTFRCQNTKPNGFRLVEEDALKGPIKENTCQEVIKTFIFRFRVIKDIGGVGVKEDCIQIDIIQFIHAGDEITNGARDSIDDEFKQIKFQFQWELPGS